MQSVDIFITCEEGAVVPEYCSLLASGADVRACISNAMVLEPGERMIVPTGIKMEIPEGYEIQVRPRSGLAAKYGITVVNTPGTIDADYRGELKVILINHGKISFTIEPGMRIAQIVLAPVVHARFVMKTELAATARGEKGFGHTGTT